MANDDTAVEKQEKDAEEIKVSEETEQQEGVVEQTNGDESGDSEEISKLKAEIEELKTKADDNWNKFLMEKAEGENARKRAM